MKETRVTFASGGPVLEGIVTIPKGHGPFPAVLICHPHPLYGGSMENNVVCSLAHALTKASLASLKFNFRGVGQSQGEFGQGIGEQADVEAAISFLVTLEEVDSERIGLVGYSAGAAFGLPVGAGDARIKALAAVSPPLSMFNVSSLEACSKPRFLISGDRDNFTDPDQFFEFCRNLDEPKQSEIVEGADHFWWGYESCLAAKVTDFFLEAL